MNKMIILQFLLVTAVFAAGFMAGEIRAAARSKVFELRTYTTNEGKLGDLNKRFREHTISIFNRHGMKSVWYGVPQDAPLRDNTLIYMLEHESREAARKSWDAFRADPEWKKVSAASEANGKIVSKIESVFLDPVDYSPLH
ncbi:MAG: NIPSNAP family protein [Bryobacterales bacterium]|nr:NIPSNAP family protein [Bryobacterales bacterium]